MTWVTLCYITWHAVTIELDTDHVSLSNLWGEGHLKVAPALALHKVGDVLYSHRYDDLQVSGTSAAGINWKHQWQDLLFVWMDLDVMGV